MRFISTHPDERDPTEAQIRRAIRMFETRGESGPHETMGFVLAPVLNYCIQKEIPFWLYYDPKAGYYMKRGSPFDLKKSRKKLKVT